MSLPCELSAVSAVGSIWVIPTSDNHCMKELNCCVVGSFSASKAAKTEDALSMVEYYCRTYPIQIWLLYAQRKRWRWVQRHPEMRHRNVRGASITHMALHGDRMGYLVGGDWNYSAGNFYKGYAIQPWLEPTMESMLIVGHAGHGSLALACADERIRDAVSVTA